MNKWLVFESGYLGLNVWKWVVAGAAGVDQRRSFNPAPVNVRS